MVKKLPKTAVKTDLRQLSLFLSESASKSTMVTLKWDSNMKIKSGGILTGGF